MVEHDRSHSADVTPKVHVTCSKTSKFGNCASSHSFKAFASESGRSREEFDWILLSLSLTIAANFVTLPYIFRSLLVPFLR